MGGATSKLEENDWSKADGKLTSASLTLDGADPSSTYRIYHLSKKGYNQREFDITDDEQNLLYTTRAVVGSLAYFDVLGRGIDEFLLRVTVDLSRRYWTVYRYNVPAFAGQKPDEEATSKLASECAERGDKRDPPKLYRKGCVIVSWSRYMAVSVMYGAPTLEMLLNKSGDQDDAVAHNEDDDDDDDLFNYASAIASRMAGRSMSNDEEDEKAEAEPSTSNTVESSVDMTDRVDEQTHTAGGATDAEPDDAIEGASLDSRTSLDRFTDQLLESTSMTELRQVKDDEIPSSASAVDPLYVAKESTRQFGQWLMTQSSAIREKSHAYLEMTKRPAKVPDPLEGVLHLDGPLLLCQEIYTKLIGNHQTSLISRERVLELLKQDMAQHIQENPDDFEEVAESNPLMQAEGLDDVDDEKTQDAHDSDEEKDADQPLVGYWLWENTFRNHKMKMHVAKGSDLALHVVLAILVNQVRYERNAVAMTI